MLEDIPAGETISLDKLVNMRGPGTYLVRVEGDSMEGAGIFSGDLLVVNKAADPVRGNIVIGVINGEPTVKRLDFANDMPVLRSENPRYPARYVLEGDDFSIWGVVTHSFRDHDRRS